MNRGIKTLLWIIFFANVVFAKTTADSLETKTVLYKITHPDFEHVSYLFGTHHAFGKPFFDSLKFAKDALLSSNILIKENLNIPGHLADDIINKRTATTKWLRYLNKADYTYVSNIFASSKMDFNKMTPAELFAFLSRYYKERACLGKNATGNYLSLDDYIGSVAEENGIELVGLETAEEQIELINKDIQGMPRKVHRKRLSSMITRIKSGNKDHCAEIDWYRNMDFDFKMDQSCQNALILTDRNNKWMDQIKKYLKTKNCFIAVGLSHLMFKCGLVSQLIEQGYIITPIEVK